MKKFAMLALAMSLFLVACGEKKEEQKPAEQPAAEATATTTQAPATEAAAEVKAFSVKTEDGKEFTLEVAADGATATLTDAEGKVTELKNAETASGERYADEASRQCSNHNPRATSNRRTDCNTTSIRSTSGHGR